MLGFYPIDWPQLSASIRFRRAGGRCEKCGRPHMQRVCQLADGRWYDADAHRWRDDRGRSVRTNLPPPFEIPPELGLRVVYVVLACAHISDDLSDCSPANLKSWCGRCHLAHDRPIHRRQRWLTWRATKAIGDLFTGRYTVPPRGDHNASG